MDCYIRRKEALNVFRGHHPDDILHYPDWWESKIKAIPIAAVESVVRCKECRYARMSPTGYCDECDRWSEEIGDHFLLHVPGDFFCAFGEKREENAK